MNPTSSSDEGKEMHFRRILKIFGIIVACAVVLAGVVFMVPRAPKNAPRFDIVAVAPIPAHFTDDNTMDFSDGAGAPGVNNNRHISDAGTLIVRYDFASGEYAPVFRMDLNEHDLDKHIEISPFIKGTWQMRGPNAIAFTPATDWPADKKFTVNIAKSLINKDVYVNTRTTSFSTPDITATIDSFAIYPDNRTPKSMIGVAVVSFNYPIDTENFADKVSMRIDDTKLDFTVKFDRFARTAIITSAPVAVTDTPQAMRLKINRIPALSGTSSTDKVTATTTIESADNFFKVSNISTTVADDNTGNPQQLVLLDMTAAAAKNTKWNRDVEIYLLPAHHDTDPDDTENHTWSIDEITDGVLRNAQRINFKPVDFATPNGVYQYALAYDVSEKGNRYIYVKVRSGIDSAAGFKLANYASRVLRVPYPAQTVEIAGRGALLSMAGDQKLGIVARGGLDAAYVNLYKVKASEINHLISQTYNVFSDMQFKSWSFDAYDLAVVFKKKINFTDTTPNRVNYASVDLGDYLDRTHGDQTGIFIVQTGRSQETAEFNDKRLILLTDLGIIRKVNLDETSTLFVSNLASGTPAVDVEITVLGRNGNAVWAGRTDEGGRADIPQLPASEYRNEKQPVAIVARRDDDVSFMPYNNAYDRQVEYSKFDTGGVYASNTTALNAFLFTDRGIYRPGEMATIGGIVKNGNFKPLAGIPVKLEIRNSRGRIAYEKTFSLTADAMFDATFEIPSAAPLGDYSVNLYSLNTKNKIQDPLGNTSLRVEEFVPDTLKIRAEISDTNNAGWMSPDDLTVNVNLRNLFGTPAANNRISATATLVPVTFSFPEFAGYIFTPNYISGTAMADARAMRNITATIKDVTTDADGNAALPITFDDTIGAGTYEMRVSVTGYERGAGRGVTTGITTRVSNAKYLVGYRADGDLDYINRGATRKISLVAVDSVGARTSGDGLTMKLMRRENQVTLVKDANDYYKYQTVTHDKVVMQQDITIPKSGATVNLATGIAGTYFLQIVDADDRVVANIEYFVAGRDNSNMNVDTNAELQIKLNAAAYAPGDDIMVSITAPYAGTGLITIERDRVYAYQWFTTDGPTSIQHITLPDDFEGTGYINVSFVRDINSRDIFTAPYTYAVAPFAADTSKRTIGVKLDAPRVLRDGKLDIKYETNRDAKIMIFAVNTGILQVAKYQIPNPIAHFFKKSALQVETFQILSLLLPEYKILHEFAQTGGGDYDGGIMDTPIATNPFARKLAAPVAFYSGIIDTTANVSSNIVFDIPETFNGEIKIFAVATNDTALGAANATTTVQSPIVISTAAPLFVAPGDTFDVNTVITNLTDDDATTFYLGANVTGDIEITTDHAATTQIDKNAEYLWTFGAAAGNIPGNADMEISVTNGKIARNATASMSVRPITTFETNVKTGLVNKRTVTITDLPTDIYPEFSNRKLYISAGAGALVQPLVEYLKAYEFPCSEQLVSVAMPYALMPDDEVVVPSRAAAAEKIAQTIDTLKSRQNDDGSFTLWGAQNVTRNNSTDTDAALITAYVAQFLTIAKENGFDVPKNMQMRAVDFLRTYSGTNISDARAAHAHAFAIYVVTRNGYVTTSYIDTFEEYVNANIKNWRTGIMGPYIAASYKMLKKDDMAYELISKYAPSPKATFEYDNEFSNNVANDAIYAYICGRYFKPIDLADIPAITGYINRGDYTSYTSASVIMGIGAGNGNTTLPNADAIVIRANDVNMPARKTKSGNLVADIPMNAKHIEIRCTDCPGKSVYYAAMIQGCPRTSHVASDGIEITREYYDVNGNRITSGEIGDRVTVKISARAYGNVHRVPNTVITDLLPGGFSADAELPTGEYEFAEMREDRILIYTTLTRSATEFTYSATLTAAGTFATAPIYASSMYNSTIRAATEPGTFTVTNATKE